MAKRLCAILSVILVSVWLLSGATPALADSLIGNGHLLPGTMLKKITYGKGVYVAVEGSGATHAERMDTLPIAFLSISN